MKRIHARIRALGTYLPDKILSNSDLEKIVDTTDEWIYSRTGMKERRIASEDEPPSFMGVKAAEKAIELAKIDRSCIDLIICATLTPDHLLPSTACLIQKDLGLEGCGALDIQASCSGFLYGLHFARACIESGLHKNVLVVASEKISSFVDYTDRSTCVLFGDGAAAAIVSVEGEGYGIRASSIGADGMQADLLSIPAGGSRIPASKESVDRKEHFIRMEGKEVFKHAVRRMEMAAKEAIERAGLQESEISYLVPHQANIRIIDAMAKRFEMPREKVFVTVDRYGNTSASACGIALKELIETHAISVGEKILLVAFGGGLTYASVIVEKLGDQ